jgi:hypothetical protein
MEKVYTGNASRTTDKNNFVDTRLVDVGIPDDYFDGFEHGLWWITLNDNAAEQQMWVFGSSTSRAAQHLNYDCGAGGGRERRR